MQPLYGKRAQALLLTLWMGIVVVWPATTPVCLMRERPSDGQPAVATSHAHDGDHARHESGPGHGSSPSEGCTCLAQICSACTVGLPADKPVQTLAAAVRPEARPWSDAPRLPAHDFLLPFANAPPQPSA